MVVLEHISKHDTVPLHVAVGNSHIQQPAGGRCPIVRAPEGVGACACVVRPRRL